MNSDPQPLLQVIDLCRDFTLVDSLTRKQSKIRAVDHLSFTLYEGETLALVGESGCGKSTAGKLILRLLDADSGEIIYRGEPLHQLSPRQMRPYRRTMQMIFQDPFASLNPRMRVGDIVSEPFHIHKIKFSRDDLHHLLQTVGLSPEQADRYPHEFSGGQRQRIGIARALSVRPDLIIADEPVSALDLSIQAQILNLLEQVQNDYKLTYLFVSHDLSVVRYISDRVMVMYLGRLVEISTTEQLFQQPSHPYTEALLQAVPRPVPGGADNRQLLHGEIPSATSPPPGCHFHPRCPYAEDICRQKVPELTALIDGRQVACHLTAQLKLKGM